MMTAIHICEERLLLRADRSLYWPRRDTLVIADPHFGKAESFRVAGVAVPGGSSESLTRLACAIAETSSTRLIILGDFWHAPRGRISRLVEELSSWRVGQPRIHIDLVPGNHDRGLSPPDGWGNWHENEFVDPPFAFRHNPKPSDAGYVLAGHLHPGVILRGSGRQRLRLPCFRFGPQIAVLPAFGMFTGLSMNSAPVDERRYVVAEDRIVELEHKPG